MTGDKLGVDPSKCLFYKGGYYERIEKMMGHWRNRMPISNQILQESL